jgi:hypothetical protein
MEGQKMPQRKLYASHAQRQAAYAKRCKEARQRQLEEKGLPPLPALPAMPGTARWRQAIANAADLLAMVGQEMEAYFDDRSEEWQQSQKGDNFRERIDAILEARDNIVELAMA